MGKKHLNVCEQKEENGGEGSFREYQHFFLLLSVYMETLKLTGTVTPVQEKQQVVVMSAVNISDSCQSPFWPEQLIRVRSSALWTHQNTPKLLTIQPIWFKADDL